MIDFAGMSDSELVVAAILAGVAHWIPFDRTGYVGELGIRGIRYCVDLDSNLLPMLSESLFDRLVVAMEEHVRTAGEPY
jgi:hypothetical protein